MVYQEKMVVVVKQKGKILREKGDCVYLPFNSEYSIALKNLNSRRVKVKIEIDGRDIMDGNALCINANTEAELMGFVKNSKVTNAFKFIKKTEEISNHRGDKLDDGLIRVEYWFETDQVYSTPVYVTPIQYPCQKCGRLNCVCVVNSWYASGAVYTSNTTTMSATMSATMSNVTSGSTVETNTLDSCVVTNNLECREEEGITVKGSSQNQQLIPVHINTEFQSKVIILRLRGIIGEKEVKKAINVKTKVVCETCGKSNRSHNDFCYKCGTALF